MLTLGMSEEFKVELTTTTTADTDELLETFRMMQYMPSLY